jgi:hypothetical protein
VYKYLDPSSTAQNQLESHESISSRREALGAGPQSNNAWADALLLRLLVWHVASSLKVHKYLFLLISIASPHWRYSNIHSGRHPICMRMLSITTTSSADADRIACASYRHTPTAKHLLKHLLTLLNPPVGHFAKGPTQRPCVR